MIAKTICISQPAYLSLAKGQLVIRLPEVEKADIPEGMKESLIAKRPIEDLEMLVLDNKQITITQGLLTALVENNTAIITCDNRNMPSGLLYPLVGNCIQEERYEYQIELSQARKDLAWRLVVERKVKNQAKVLELCDCENYRALEEYCKSVKDGDRTNIEARAASVYWKSLFKDTAYPDFTRSRDGNPPNNLLNYGYAIIRALVAKALISTGLLPTLGIHHKNRYNPFCLADDMMEPYRPYVDSLVYEIVADGSESIYEITSELKRRLLTLPSVSVIIGNRKTSILQATSQTAASLLSFLKNERNDIELPIITE